MKSFLLRISITSAIAALIIWAGYRQGMAQIRYAMSHRPLHELYNALADSTNTRIARAIEQDDTRALDSIAEQWPDTLFALLYTHLQDEWADTLLMTTCHEYTPWQKRLLLDSLPESKQSNEWVSTLREMYKSQCSDLRGGHYTDVRMLDTEYNNLNLSDLVGHHNYVLVYFWASWHKPSCDLIPMLDSLYCDYHATIGLEILSVTLDLDTRHWLQVLQQYAMPWPQARHVGNYPYLSKEIYMVDDLPTILLINREGTIILHNPSLSEIRTFLKTTN